MKKTKYKVVIKKNGEKMAYAQRPKGCSCCKIDEDWCMKCSLMGMKIAKQEQIREEDVYFIIDLKNSAKANQTQKKGR